MISLTRQILIFTKSESLCELYREILTARGFDLFFANSLSRLDDLNEKIPHLSHVIFDEEMNHFPMVFLNKLKQSHDSKLVFIGIFI
jgi:DNA-binding NtrC family response regulator